MSRCFGWPWCMAVWSAVLALGMIPAEAMEAAGALSLGEADDSASGEWTMADWAEEEAPPPETLPEPAPDALGAAVGSLAPMELSPALQGVIRLLRSSVEEEVLLAHIGNSMDTFHVGSEEILYLTDLGMPGAVIRAMIERDAQLQGFVSAGEPVSPAEADAMPQGAEPPLDLEGINESVYRAGEVVVEEEVVVYSARPEVVTVQYFQEYLAPYGTWVEIPGYGLCWQPAVAVSTPGWRPYGSRGRWLTVDDGWYWYSDYSWGWAAFHYGRWFHHGRWGWCWAPDTVWGPSWVTWRSYGDYCGWAPLPPHYGSGFSFSVGYAYGLPSWCYTYVPYSRVYHHHPSHYAAPHHHAKSIHQHAVVCDDYRPGRNHEVVNYGIPPEKIHSHSGVHAPKASVHVADAHGPPDHRSEWMERGGKPVMTAHRPAPLPHGDGRPPESQGGNGRPPAVPAGRHGAEPAGEVASTVRRPDGRPADGGGRETVSDTARNAGSRRPDTDERYAASRPPAIIERDAPSRSRTPESQRPVTDRAGSVDVAEGRGRPEPQPAMQARLSSPLQNQVRPTDPRSRTDSPMGSPTRSVTRPPTSDTITRSALAPQTRQANPAGQVRPQPAAVTPARPAAAPAQRPSTTVRTTTPTVRSTPAATPRTSTARIARPAVTATARPAPAPTQRPSTTVRTTTPTVRSTPAATPRTPTAHVARPAVTATARPAPAPTQRPSTAVRATPTVRATPAATPRTPTARVARPAVTPTARPAPAPTQRPSTTVRATPTVRTRTPAAVQPARQARVSTPAPRATPASPQPSRPPAIRPSSRTAQGLQAAAPARASRAIQSASRAAPARPAALPRAAPGGSRPARSR
jgi:hypothetical protein